MTVAAMPTRSPSRPRGEFIDTREVWPISVAKYHELIRHGFFGDEERIELLEGLLVRRNSAAIEVDPTLPEAPFLMHISELWPISVAQYHDLIRTGFFGDDENIELLEGVLVKKMNKNPPHGIANRRVHRALIRVLPGGYFDWNQNAIQIEQSAPEPDLAIVRGRDSDFRDRNPPASNVALVIEVAESSLARDHGPKKQLYASAGIPVYWIVNLVDRVIEVYTKPTVAPPDYAVRRDYHDQESVPIVLDEIEVGQIRTGDLLP